MGKLISKLKFWINYFHGKYILKLSDIKLISLNKETIMLININDIKKLLFKIEV